MMRDKGTLVENQVCPQCHEKLKQNTRNCKNCGAFIAKTQYDYRPKQNIRKLKKSEKIPFDQKNYVVHVANLITDQLLFAHVVATL